MEGAKPDHLVAPGAEKSREDDDSGGAELIDRLGDKG
jgi:hypothetical protein